MIIVAKYSDYAIQSINYFVKAIEDDINYRDIKGLSNGTVDFIKVSKEHPLVTLMASKLGESRNSDLLRSNLIPAIAVTPGSAENQDFGMGLSMSDRSLTDDDIVMFRSLLSITDNGELQEQGLITHDQIKTIMAAYRKRGDNTLKVHENQWGRNEEVNISCWADTPDMDGLMDNIINSVLAGIRAKMPGDESPLRNMKFKTTRGLTNFNFGRVLYGSEYSLTFLNVYNNYTVFTDQPFSVEVELDFTTPGV